MAIDLSNQLNTVFVSSHAVVREYLASLPKTEQIAVCYPVLELKYEWIEKLRLRFLRTKLEKDFRAWKEAEKQYDDNIKDMMTCPFIQMPIESMDYKLESIIERYEL